MISLASMLGASAFVLEASYQDLADMGRAGTYMTTAKYRTLGENIGLAVASVLNQDGRLTQQDVRRRANEVCHR